MSKKPFHLEARASVFENARQLKNNLTEAEDKLWQALRNKKLCGLKFRRQHPVDSYILDFYCHEKKLAIEVDGKIHLKKEIQEYDDDRTYTLQQQDIKVIRFTNEEVFSDVFKVLNEIKKHL